MDVNIRVVTELLQQVAILIVGQDAELLLAVISLAPQFAFVRHQVAAHEGDWRRSFQVGRR